MPFPLEHKRLDIIITKPNFINEQECKKLDMILLIDKSHKICQMICLIQVQIRV